MNFKKVVEENSVLSALLLMAIGFGTGYQVYAELHKAAQVSIVGAVPVDADIREVSRLNADLMKMQKEASALIEQLHTADRDIKELRRTLVDANKALASTAASRDAQREIVQKLRASLAKNALSVSNLLDKVPDDSVRSKLKAVGSDLAIASTIEKRP